MVNQGDFRLITRADFDGIVCAALLDELGLIRDVEFARPKDMQDGRVPVENTDILANLPFNPNAHMVFDHHSSESVRIHQKSVNFIISPSAKSAARVIYDHYEGPANFPHQKYYSLMEAVDKCDSGQFNMREIMAPTGWILINFLIDPRTGITNNDAFKSNHTNFLKQLVGWCQEHTIEEIIEFNEVKQRVDFYKSNDRLYKDQLKEITRIKGNVAIVDLRGQTGDYIGNRFILYALFIEANISIEISNNQRTGRTELALGKSVLNQSSNLNIAALMLKYGGGGHANAGTCQVPIENADRIASEIIDYINREE